MAVADSRTFRSGNSEAVRLPRNVAFGPEVEVTIVRSGDVLTIYPTRKPIGELVKQLEQLPRPAEIEARDDEMRCWRPCRGSRSMMLLPMRIGRSSKRSGIRGASC